MTPEDGQRIRELLDMHPALLQPEALELRRHLLDARDDLAAVRAAIGRWQDGTDAPHDVLAAIRDRLTGGPR
jgi:hypothetical protein